MITRIERPDGHMPLWDNATLEHGRGPKVAWVLEKRNWMLSTSLQRMLDDLAPAYDEPAMSTFYGDVPILFNSKKVDLAQELGSLLYVNKVSWEILRSDQIVLVATRCGSFEKPPIRWELVISPCL